MNCKLEGQSKKLVGRLIPPSEITSMKERFIA